MFDLSASTVGFFALVLVDASIYQMLHGLYVVTVSVLSMVFLKRVFYRHHFLAMGLVVLGVFLVGLAEILFDEEKKSKHDLTQSLVGIIMLLISQVLASG